MTQSIPSVHIAQVLYQRLAREEFDAGIQLSEIVNSRLGSFAFNRYAQPNIARNQPCGEILCHSFGTFGEYLVAVLGGQGDGAHDTVNELKGDFLVEDVAH